MSSSQIASLKIYTKGVVDSRENLHEKLRYFTLLFVRIKSKGNKDRKRKVVPTFIRGLCLMSRKR